MRYSICYLIRGEFAKYHSKLVVELGNKFDEKYLIQHLRPCHITLKYSFEGKNNIKEIENLLEKISNNSKSESIRIDKLNQLNDKVVVFQLNFSNNAKVIINDLIKELKKINWIEWRNYDKQLGIYHLTLIYGNTFEIFNKIWSYVTENLHPNFELKFDNLTILKETSPNIWKVHKTFEFQK